mmetsp:Transcript_15243/g.37516  ORF Transcript_15243/g.37516 Transcript_15243/m.37516 type:complete len:81 (+) Transcript_15243:1782-2024(+)
MKSAEHDSDNKLRREKYNVRKAHTSTHNEVAVASIIAIYHHHHRHHHAYIMLVAVRVFDVSATKNTHCSCTHRTPQCNCD